MRMFASRACVWAVVAIGWSAAIARADPVGIDQQNVGTRLGGFGIGGTTSAIAETFSVGVTGVLTQLDLSVFNPNPGSTQFPDPLSIQIRSTSAGQPVSTALRSMTVPLASVTVDRLALTSFVGWNVDVTAGEVLAIVLTTGANGNYGWSIACCYSGGDMFVSRGSGFVPIFPNVSAIPGDFIFRTYVDPTGTTSATPEPASLLLCASGLVAAFFPRFRRSFQATVRRG
jgi:hypothetical protein